MNTIITNIQAWFSKQGGFAHACAALFLSCVALYAAVPAFSQLLDSIYQSMPKSLHEVCAAAIGVALFYANTAKKASNQ